MFIGNNVALVNSVCLAFMLIKVVRVNLAISLFVNLIIVGDVTG